jgi:hypothetical protein
MMCLGPGLCPLHQQAERQRSYYRTQHILWAIAALAVAALIVWSSKC